MTRSSAEHVLITICPVTATFKSKIGMHNRMACPYSRVWRLRYQCPIILAWAVVFHKVQGLKLVKAIFKYDLGQSVFAHGQAYVALCITKPLEGVMLV